MPDAIINGKRWSTAHTSQKADSCGSGYILLRTDGEPLNWSQKTELGDLGVRIHEFLGGVFRCEDDNDDDNEQQLYLCGYPKGSSLDPIRELNYIDYADNYPHELVIHDAMERLRARRVMHHRDSWNSHVNLTDGIVPGELKISDYHNFISGRMPQPVYCMESGSTAAHLFSDTKDTTFEVNVALHHDIAGEAHRELISKISAVRGVKEVTAAVNSCMTRLKVEEDALDTIAKFDEVRVIHPVNKPALFANVARQLLGFPAPEKSSSVNIDNATSPSSFFPPSCLSSDRYQGRDQLVCVADTGFDKGSKQTCTKPSPTASSPCIRGDERPPPTTLTAMALICILGRGEHKHEGQVTGTAPAAHLMLQSFFSEFHRIYVRQPVLQGYPPDLGHIFQQAYEAGARIHNNSWGNPQSAEDNFQQHPYGANAESTDRFVWAHQDMTVLFAAGNDGRDTNWDGKVNERSLGAEASAKNCITVGASESLRPTLRSGKHGDPYTYGFFWEEQFRADPLRNDHIANNPEGLAAFSSRGPTAENRLKPDLVAPGTAILSARSRNKQYVSGVDYMGVSGDDRYQYLSGTSMATPLVAGCCAVVREALLANGYQDRIITTVSDSNSNGNGDTASSLTIINPTGALIKALLINGAVPIKGQCVPVHLDHGPNPHSGFGRVNVASTIAMIEPEMPGMGGYGIGTLSEKTAEPFSVQIAVPKQGLTFKITMAYADLPGALLANDINLVAIAAGSRERHGNQGTKEFNVGDK